MKIRPIMVFWKNGEAHIYVEMAEFGWTERENVQILCELRHPEGMECSGDTRVTVRTVAPILFSVTR